MVRIFPRTTRRRVMVALAAGSMLLSVAASPLASADNLKHKKHKVQHHIKVAHHDLDESSAQLRKATRRLHTAQAELRRARGHLATTRGHLTAARALDRQMQAKLELARARLADARTELRDGRAEIVEQEHQLGRIVVQNYQNGSPALMGLSMVLTTQDPTELTGQLNSVHNVIDKEEAILQRLKASKVLLEVREQQVQAAKVAVAERREAAAENLERRQALEEQAQQAAAEVHTLVGKRADARQDAAQARKHDLRVLKKLKKEAARISKILKKRAERARRRAAKARAAKAAKHGVRNGFLTWPATGPVTSPFGWRIHPIYGYRSLHDGIDIAIPCGTPLRAPASGRVLEEYYNTAWGNRMILDLGYHRGVGLAVILNHMSGYVAHRGQHVRRGQVVGYSGTTGWSTGCHLHFTVMANGSPVNPLGWL